MKSLLFTIGLIVSCNVFAQQTYVCTRGETIRTIEVIYATEGEQVPCKVVYTKQNKSKTLWSANTQIGYCENKAQEFAQKQQGGGWICTAPYVIQGEQKQEIKQPKPQLQIEQANTVPPTITKQASIITKKIPSKQVQQVMPQEIPNTILETKPKAPTNKAQKVSSKKIEEPAKIIKPEVKTTIEKVVYSKPLFLLK